MTRTILFAAAALAWCGCGTSEEKKPAPAPAPAAAVVEPAAAEPAIDPALHAFCVRSMHQIMKCFEDDAFWDVYATTYFAAQEDQAVEPERKELWIGLQKDSIVALARDKEFEQNCAAMLAENKLPTAAQVELVDQAAGASCTAFGGALGWIIFGEGAFFLPRDGHIPPSLP